MWKKIFFLVATIITITLSVVLGVIFFTKEKNNSIVNTPDEIVSENIPDATNSSEKVEEKEEEVKKEEKKKILSVEDLPAGLQEAMEKNREELLKKEALQEKREKMYFDSINNSSFSLFVSYLDKRVMLIKSGKIILTVVFNDIENSSIPMDARDNFKSKIKTTNIYNNSDYAVFLSSFFKERSINTITNNHLKYDLGIKEKRKNPIVWEINYNYNFNYIAYIPELYDVREKSYTKNILEYLLKWYQNSVEHNEQKGVFSLTSREKLVVNQKATIPFLLNIQPRWLKYFNTLYFDLIENFKDYHVYEMQVDSNNFNYLYLFKKIIYGRGNYKNALAANLKETYGDELTERMWIYDNPTYTKIRTFEPVRKQDILWTDLNDEKMKKDISTINKYIINNMLMIKSDENLLE